MSISNLGFSETVSSDRKLAELRLESGCPISWIESDDPENRDEESESCRCKTLEQGINSRLMIGMPEAEVVRETAGENVKLPSFSWPCKVYR